MPRIKLVPLKNYRHTFETAVEVTDLNYGNHLGNDTLVGIIHRARVHFLQWLDARENDLGDGKTGILLADIVVNYKGEGFLFDSLAVESSIGELQPKGFRMFHRVTTGAGRLIALAEVGVAAFDYQKRKVARIPRPFIDRVENLITAATEWPSMNATAPRRNSFSRKS